MTELIKSFAVTKLHNQECFGFHQRVLALATATLSNEIILNTVSAYRSSVEQFDEALLQEIANSWTEQVKAADEKVDNLYIGLSYYLRGMERHPNATLAEKGKRACAIIDKYGSIARLNYTEEYGILHNVLQDFNALPEDVNTELQLETWLEALTLAIAQFQVLRESQASEGSQYKTGLAKEKRHIADEAYRKLVDTVNALASALGTEDYKDFISRLNFYIAEEESKLKQRSTINAKNKKEDPTEPETPDTPETPESGTTPETSA